MSVAPAQGISRLSGITLPGRQGRWDVTVADGRITAIEPSQARSGWLCLPGFREPHLHADRAYLRPAQQPRTFEEAVRTTLQLRRGRPVRDIARRARRILERAAAHGVVQARTHTDVDDVVGLRCIEALVQVREQLRQRLDVEIVAFATTRADPADHRGRAQLRAALDAGADLLGGVVNLYPDPRASIRALVDLATERDVDLDVHVDETLEGERAWVVELASAVATAGLLGRLTVSHACLLATYEGAALTAAIDALLAAGATVVALPATNLYLQDRGVGTPRRRGITIVRELAAAGVPVRFGSDNVQDTFFPYGDGDPLEAAYLAALAAHVEDEGTLLAGVCGGRTTIEPGMDADLVLLPVASFTDAVAIRPSGRTVLRRGVVVAGPALPDG